jgi:hypothetical protein
VKKISPREENILKIAKQWNVWTTYCTNPLLKNFSNRNFFNEVSAVFSVFYRGCSCNFIG